MHLSTHLVTGDGREDALVRPGYQLSATILNISTLVYIQPTDKRKIVLYGGRSWTQLCSHSGRATRWRRRRRWWWWRIFRPHRLHTVHRFGLLLPMSHVAWSVCVSVGHDCEPCTKSWFGYRLVRPLNRRIRYQLRGGTDLGTGRGTFMQSITRSIYSKWLRRSSTQWCGLPITTMWPFISFTNKKMSKNYRNTTKDRIHI